MTTYLCMLLEGNYRLELHFTDYFGGTFTYSHGLGSPNYRGYGHVFGVLSSRGSTMALVYQIN